MVTFETKYGTVEIKSVMVDLDGTNLEDGVDVYLNDEYVGDVVGYSENDFKNEDEDENENLTEKVECFLEEKFYSRLF